MACKHWMYSTAWPRILTFDIFLSQEAVGTRRRRVSNPLFTVWTRFLSLAFLLIVLRSSWGLILYPCTGWITTSLGFGAITRDLNGCMTIGQLSATREHRIYLYLQLVSAHGSAAGEEAAGGGGGMSRLFLSIPPFIHTGNFILIQH